jgi:signal peptidase I
MNTKKALHELKVFLVMILVISSLRSALADWNDVPTGSMKPTIQEGDRVVVNKLAYDLKVPFTTIELMKWGDPKRGDIVVLFSPYDGVRLVKRVVAVPGDRVALRNEQLFVNGQPAVWKPLGEVQDPEQGQALILEESVAGKSHNIMLTPALSGDKATYGPVIVPDGHYFVMGDNRDNSNDSRFIGTIERNRIVGKALAVAFSLDRAHYFKPRFDRFFKSID